MSYFFLTAVPMVLLYLPFVFLFLIFLEIAREERKMIGILSLLFFLFVCFGLWINQVGGTFGSFLFLVFVSTMSHGGNK